MSHNELGTKGLATRYKPWTLVHSEIYESKGEAMAREKFFKSGIGRNLFLEIVKSKGYRKLLVGLIPAKADIGSSPVSL